MHPTRYVCAVAAFAAAALTAHATTYNFITLTPTQGVNAFNRGGINNLGEVAGYGYVYNGSTYTYTNFPIQQLGGIDDTGNIVGWQYNNNFNGSDGLFGALGSPTSFDVPGASYTFATGISGNGQIAGYYIDAVTGRQRMFINDGGNITTFDYLNTPTFNQEYLWDVNNSGDSVGLSACCNAGVPFLRQGNTFTTISGMNIAEGLNDFDVVVGWMVNGSNEHGVIWQSGVSTILDVPGATNTLLFDINNSGVIFGGYTDASNHQFNFLAVPATGETPEPAALCMAGSGLLAVSLVLRRFQKPEPSKGASK
jgi:hypothetical protein